MTIRKERGFRASLIVAILTLFSLLLIPHLADYSDLILPLFFLPFGLFITAFYNEKYLTYSLFLLISFHFIKEFYPVVDIFSECQTEPCEIIDFVHMTWDFLVPLSLLMILFSALFFREGRGDIKTYIYYISSIVISSISIIIYINYKYTYLPYGNLIVQTIIFGSLFSLLIKLIMNSSEDEITLEAVGLFMTMLLLQSIGFSNTISDIFFATLISFSFGYAAFRSKTADITGIVSSVLVGITLLLLAKPTWFIVMLAFFVLGSLATLYRYDYKVRIGVEQGQSGARGYRNVFSNGFAGAAAAAFYGYVTTHSPDPLLWQSIAAIIFVGSVATAAADTLASEIGVTGSVPYMITTFKKVPIGTNGGVTPRGEIVALLGGFVISCIALYCGVLLRIEEVLLCTLISFIGTNLDSLIGAVLENKGILGNAGTNLLATTISGLLGALIYFFYFSC